MDGLAVGTWRKMPRMGQIRNYIYGLVIIKSNKNFASIYQRWTNSLSAEFSYFFAGVNNDSNDDSDNDNDNDDDNGNDNDDEEDNDDDNDNEMMIMIMMMMIMIMITITIMIMMMII